MSFDYTPFSELSAELCQEFGRSVSFIELGDVPDNAAEPWLGTATVRSAPTRTLSLSAVFVEPTSLEQLGSSLTRDDFVARSSKICLVYSATALEDFEEVLDTDGSRWRIQGMTRLQPGDTSLLYYVGVNR